MESETHLCNMVCLIRSASACGLTPPGTAMDTFPSDRSSSNQSQCQELMQPRKIELIMKEGSDRSVWSVRRSECEGYARLVVAGNDDLEMRDGLA